MIKLILLFLFVACVVFGIIFSIGFAAGLFVAGRKKD